jgi:transposase
VFDAASNIEVSLSELQARLAELTASNQKLASERDQYRQLYLETLELCRKLELGLLGQKREKLSGNDAQLTLALLSMLTGKETSGEKAAGKPASSSVRAHERAKPTGRKPLPETLPRIDIEVLPPEVQREGLDAFERIGEDTTETVERRTASFVVVRHIRPIFVRKDRDLKFAVDVHQAPPPELPIERGLAGPGLLAETIVKRWEDHLPLHRMERIYGRDGLPLARSTICGWHAELANLAKPLIDAMWDDAFKAPYLCTDATGVLVQARERCHTGHFWVVAAPEMHVLFGYSQKHDSAAIDSLLSGYKGYLVADAHAVFDHLYKTPDIVECGCWAHCRRYYFKALSSDPERARHALALIQELFQIERAISRAPPEERKRRRQAESKPILDKFFAWCDEQAPFLLDETPIAKAVGYARNQRDALMRFLEDGRLPIHNNFSERQLRREAIGRRNWLFLGTDEAGEVNATFVSLLASCRLHEIEPWGYLRDLLCLLPSWPKKRVLELAPAYWKKTLENEATQQLLAANAFRRVSLGTLNQSASAQASHASSEAAPVT